MSINASGVVETPIDRMESLVLGLVAETIFEKAGVCEMQRQFSASKQRKDSITSQDSTETGAN